MLYCISSADQPIKYVSSGNLNNSDQFVHPRRLLDTFVLILVQEGVLHISTGANFYDVKKGEFAILFAGQEHYGYKPSDGYLSYCWAHFTITDPEYKFYSNEEMQNIIDAMGKDSIYLLPEYGALSFFKRSDILFLQLLDIAKRDHYVESWKCNYAISLLLLEITSDIINSQTLIRENYPQIVENVISFIQANYDQPLTVSGLAEQFNYHPTYLTSVFKKYTSYSLVNYINITRINVAKGLLVSAPVHERYSLSEIAQKCGFSSEKYFIRVFEKYENITPSEYRNSFAKKRINKE